MDETRSNGALKAAQVRWELNLTVLQEEERRLFAMLEEQSRDCATLPPETLDRLKAARLQCNEAFRSLMRAIENRLAPATPAQVPARRRDHAS